MLSLFLIYLYHQNYPLYSMTTSNMNDLSAKIRSLREFHQYKQEYVASVLGISQSGYSKIENGEIWNVNLQHILKIAELYKLSPEQLFGWDGKINIHTVNGVGVNYGTTTISKSTDDRLSKIEESLEKLAKEISLKS